MSNEITIVVGARDQSGPGIDSAERRQKKLAQSTKDTGQAYDEAGKRAGGFGATLKRVGEVAAGVLAAEALQAGARRAIALIQSTVKAASDLGESVNAVNKVFDASSARVLQWGKDNANAIGLSTRAFNQMATPLGSMLKNQGLSLDQVTEHTIKLTQRAADMASVFNTDVADALVAIQAGLRGEQDPLERYGVSLSAVSVEARALADSHKTSTSQLTAQEKALARLNLIYEQTADSAGDFRDTADGLANSQRIATATIEDAKAKIGTAFIPVMAEAAKLTGQFADVVANVPPGVLTVVAAVGGLAAALLLVAPRIVATKDALERMSASGSKGQEMLSKTAVFATKAAAGLTAVSLAAMAVNAAVGGRGVNVQVDALADSLAHLGDKSLMVGEGVRVFGGDLENLKYDLGTLGSGFWAQFGNGLAGIIELFGDFGQDQSLTKAKERIAGIDAALASLVQSGRAAEAAAAFAFLSAQAEDAGISVDDLKAGLPAYAAAMQLAGKTTTAAATEIEQAAGAANKAWADTFTNFDTLETAYEKALDKLTGKQHLTAAQYIKELQDMVAEQEAWAANMKKLATRVPADMLEQLRQLGPKGAAEVALLAAMSDAQLQQVIALYQRSGAAAAQGFASGITGQLDAIEAAATAARVAATRGGQQRRQTGGFAHGGIVGAGEEPSYAASGGIRGGRVVVGEYGREVVDLPYGSSVHPHGTSEAMLGSGGTSVQWTARPVVVTGNAAAQALWQWLLKEIRDQGGTLAVLGLKTS